MSSTKLCPTCHREFEPNFHNCPFDGETLVGAEEAAAALTDPLLGRRLGDTYQLQKLLGAGAMGAVYAARHVRLDTSFAIKVLRPELSINTELLARFHREARSACQLKQPNIINVFDVNKTDDGIHYIVQELLEGESLGDHLRNQGPLEPAAGIPILTQICDAMAAAHARGIVHRDLKPENIFLCHSEEGPDSPGQEGFVKVLDFGIAKMHEAGTQLTTPLDIMGTPYYMAPEQAMGSANADDRSDIYSLGVIIYQMFTSCLPFQATDLRALLAMIQVENPVPPRQQRPDLPVALEAVILRAMARDPGQRYQSMSDLKQALQQLVQVQPVPESTPSVPLAPTLPSEPALAPVPETVMQPPPVAPLPAPPDSLLKGQVEAPGPQGGGKLWLALGLLGLVMLVAAGALALHFMGNNKPTSPPGEPSKTRIAAGEPARLPVKPTTPDSRPPAPRAPQGMLLIRGGSFTMGHDRGSRHERPAHPCRVGDFYIDRDEVTWKEFEAFLASPAGARVRARKPYSGIKLSETRRRLPVTGVTWQEADAFCRAEPGRSLPSEAQWEYAARGPEHSWLFPGGGKPPGPQYANFKRKRSSVAMLRPAGKPLGGLADICGNAAEWVADHFSLYTKKGCEHRKPPARAALARYRVIRGGGFDDHDPARLRVTFRLYQDPQTFRWKSLGFRCVKEVKKP